MHLQYRKRAHRQRLVIFVKNNLWSNSVVNIPYFPSLEMHFKFDVFNFKYGREHDSFYNIDYWTSPICLFFLLNMFAIFKKGYMVFVHKTTLFHVWGQYSVTNIVHENKTVLHSLFFNYSTRIALLSSVNCHKKACLK